MAVVPDLLTIPLTAKQLGCSDNHVYRLIAIGELPAVDISLPGARKSKTRVAAGDLAAYIERHTRIAKRASRPRTTPTASRPRAGSESP